jgi:hypothetical protein
MKYIDGLIEAFSSLKGKHLEAMVKDYLRTFRAGPPEYEQCAVCGFRDEREMAGYDG